MSWKMLDLAVRRLNVSALRDWKSVFESMSVWMQAIMVGALVLLIGVSALSCWWGLKMKRSARFAAGAAAVFYIVMIVLATEYSMPLVKALIIVALSGVGAGFLYAFVERAFQFLAGFVFGTILSSFVLQKYFHLNMTSGSGRVWTLVIAIGAGALFALAAKKLRFVLTALEGGIILGLLCDAFLPVKKIPLVKEKLTGAQMENLLPLVFAASGILIQLFQLLAIRAERKALAIPTGDERDHIPGAEDRSEHSGSDADPEAEVQNEDAISMAQAEEVLVEKAKELALAATRSAEHARLKERYEDVVAGLYSTQVASERLGMSEEAFVEGMKKAGYSIPGQEEEAKQTAAGQEGEEEQTAAGQEEEAEHTAAGQEEEAKQTAAGQEGEEEQTAVGQEKTVTDAAGQENDAANDISVQEETVQEETAQEETAQEETAQEETTQEETAQESDTVQIDADAEKTEEQTRE